MSNSLPASFKSIRTKNVEQNPSTSEKPKGNLPKSFTPIDKKTKEDSMWKSLARTAYQIPSGIAQAMTYPIDLMQMVGIGESLDPEEIERLEEISKREGIPFNKEKYLKSVQKAAETFPTVSNIERGIEEKTGLPLTAKTRLQKGLRFASSAGKFTPGTVSQKLAGGAIASGTKESLQEAGVPEPLAELAGFGTGIGLGAKTPPIQAEISKITKPSGLPVRRFESLKEPRKVSVGKLEQINEKIGKDFKEVSNKIIKDSPVGETFENLKNDPTFKQESRELLNQAQEIADVTPGSLPTADLKNEMSKLAGKEIKGYAYGEYDKNYMKFVNDEIKSIASEEVSHGKLVEQYRKNNSALSEYFEPGASKAFNRAKRDAILDHNRAIASVMEKSNPELSKVFKEGNDRWTKIMDVEAIDEFVNEIFSDKINYKKAHDFFDKTGYDRIFKRSLGEKGFNEFETLMKDLLDSEVPYKMLKIGKERGFRELGETAGAFFIHPTLGKAKLTYEAGKKTYKALINSLLDKPQLTFKFKHATDNLKKGKFAAAEQEFKTLYGELLEPTAEDTARMKHGRMGEEHIGQEVEVKGELIKEPKRINNSRK